MAALSLRVTAHIVEARALGRGDALREELAGKTQTSLIVLLGASAAVLLIACVNLANLLLSRGAGAPPRSGGARGARRRTRPA